MGNRRKAREIAFQFLYEVEVGGEDVAQAFNNFPEKCEEKQIVKDFAFKLVKGVCENLQRIDEMLAKCSANWLPVRMTPVDRNIMRVGTYEIIYDCTPSAVAINEAIEIAKKFGAEKSSKFVNGMLDCVRKNSEMQPENQKGGQATFRSTE